MCDPGYLLDQRELVTTYEQIRAQFRAARVQSEIAVPSAALAPGPARAQAGGTFLADGQQGGTCD